MTDFFRPRSGIAQVIYDAFQAEAFGRNGREIEEWQEAERQAVWRVARDCAEKNNLHVPTLEEIKEAEHYALGSVDYGAKWAYKIVEIMKGVNHE
jgi:transcription initiation factor TFIIIB Brf1 subunit/transcription initiation factor TFIIB